MQNTVMISAQYAGNREQSAFERRMPGHHDRLAMERQQRKSVGRPVVSASLLKTLFLISSLLFLLASIIYFAAHWFGDELSRGGHSISQEKLEIVIGNDVINVPANMVRFSSQRKSGVQPRLELYVHWPTMSGYKENLRNRFNAPSEKSDLIFLTLENREMSFDMSGRILPIYSKFFDGGPYRYKAGLVRQPLSIEGGFIDEDLYYAAGSPYPYAARCVRENSSTGTPLRPSDSS